MFFQNVYFLLDHILHLHDVFIAVHIPSILKAGGMGGRTIVIGGRQVGTSDEAQLLQEEQEIELQEVHVRSQRVFEGITHGGLLYLYILT